VRIFVKLRELLRPRFAQANNPLGASNLWRAWEAKQSVTVRAFPLRSALCSFAANSPPSTLNQKTLNRLRSGKSTTCVGLSGPRRVELGSKRAKPVHFPTSTRLPTHLCPIPTASVSRSCGVAERPRKFARHKVPGKSVPKPARPAGTTEPRTLSIPDFMRFMGSLFKFFALLLAHPPRPNTNPDTVSHTASKSNVDCQNPCTPQSTNSQPSSLNQFAAPRLTLPAPQLTLLV
jgi:hypothetical protein